MRTAIALLTAVLLLLCAAPAMAGDIGVTVAYEDGSQLELSLSATGGRHSLSLSRAQTVTVTVSGPTEHSFSINYGSMTAGQAQARVAVSGDVLVQITQMDGDGNVTVYELYFQLQTVPEPPSLSEPQPEPEPEPEPAVTQPTPAAPAQTTPTPAETTPTQAVPTPAESAPAAAEEAAPAAEEPAAMPEAETPPIAGPGVAEGLTVLLRVGSREMTVNGQLLLMDTAPFLEKVGNSGYTMVPIRFIAEALGATVYWDGAAKQVQIHYQQQTLTLTIGQPADDSGVAALIRDSRTFVPLRYVMEALGATVLWQAADQSITITGQAV